MPAKVKDQLAIIKDKVLLKVVKQHVGDEELLGVFKADYLTTSPINLDPGTVGFELESMLRGELYRARRTAGKPFKVIVVVSHNHVYVFNRSSKKIFHLAKGGDVSTYMFEKGKPVSLTYLQHNVKLAVDFCHMFLMKNKYLERGETAFQELTSHQEGNNKTHIKKRRQSTAVGNQRVLGAYSARYIGSTPVKRKMGDRIVADAAALLLRKLKKSKTPPQNVIIMLSREALKVHEAMVEEATDVLDVHLKDISYSTVCNEGSDNELFGCIENDDRLDVVVCHVFSCARDVPDDICQVIGRGKDAMLEAQEAKQGDPFAPETRDVEPVEGLLSNHQLVREHITSVKVLGAGQFGTVYLAVKAIDTGSEGESFGFEESSEEEDTQCAVKILRLESTAEDQQEFRQECETMVALEHPNVVKLIGVCFELRPWMAVLEMMLYGDVRKVMRTCGQKRLVLHESERLTMIAQACAGMEFIASQGFVHMDIAARNMLLHTNNVVKIADFGITKKMDPETKNFSLRGFLRLAVRWLAPECLSGKPILFSESSDMWAFGVFMWEVYKYGVLPFAKLKSAEARDAIKDGAVLPKPQFATEEMYEEIMMKCWCVDPAERWTFASLHTKLNELLDVARAEKPPRDVGAELNAVLNKNLRKMSKKVSMVAKSKKKLAGTSAQFRDRKKSFESTLATMKEGAADIAEEEDHPASPAVVKRNQKRTKR